MTLDPGKFLNKYDFRYPKIYILAELFDGILTMQYNNKQTFNDGVTTQGAGRE